MIEDLHTYTLDRFIPFTAETYSRLFERQHAAFWPAPVFAAIAGLAFLVFAWRGRLRSAALLLALALAGTAVTFHFALYAELTPVGTIFGWAFLAEAALVLAWALAGRPAPADRSTLSFWLGLILSVVGIAMYPLLAVSSGQPWNAAPIFGLAPDPTICATLGLVCLAASRAWLAVLLPVPLLWCAASGATLQVLDAPFAWLPPAAGALGLIGALAGRRTSKARDKS